LKLRLDDATKSKIQSAIDRLKEAVKSDNTATMQSAIDEFNKVWNDASTQMYSQATQNPGAGAEQGAGPQAGSDPNAGADASGEKVENADFEVVDDKDKK